MSSEASAPRRSVVVTGLGASTPLGGDAPATWSGLLTGRSGVQLLTKPWAESLPVRIAAPAAVDPADVLDRVEARKLDRGQQLALLAAREAWRDAGAPQVDPERLGVVVASGMGGVLTLLSAYDTLRENGARRVSPHTVPMLMPNGPAAVVGLEVKARAGVHTPVSACASGAEGISWGVDMIRSGRADVVVAGGVEAAIHPLPLAGFAAMMALSRRHDEPARASRPYDKGRDGFVLGEGAGIVVLESAEHAARREARVYCEAAGVGMSADGHHIVQPEPGGLGAGRAMRLALGDAELDPTQIVHINAHATSTPQGDMAEAKAIQATFGTATDKVAVSGTKSMTGHLLGGAGAVEAIFTILALTKRMAPPTINVTDLDDEIQLDIVRDTPRPLPAGRIAALSNSFGFGGHNIALAFQRFE